ncbi:MAG TPA: hypothetical protein VNF04_05500 [Stellaceae bacterium]|nr:hypothetical protein [Stellaceae bacterium]
MGTWVGVSLIADTLVREGVIEREALAAPLAEAAMLAKGHRRAALAALLFLIDTAFT